MVRLLVLSLGFPRGGVRLLIGKRPYPFCRWSRRSHTEVRRARRLRDQPRSIWHDINKPMARFGVQVPRRGSADQSGSAEAMMLLMGIIGKQKHRQTHNRGGPYPPEPTCATYRRFLMPLLDRLPRVFLVHRSPLHTWRRHPRSCLGRLTPSTSSGVLGSPILLLQGRRRAAE